MRIGMKMGAFVALISLLLAGAAAAWPQQEYLAGYLMVLISVIVMCFSVTVNGSPWWKLQGKLQDHWLPLCHAIRYIIYESKWASSTAVGSKQDADSVLEKKIIEALARGDISARGRRVVSQYPYRLAPASEPIPTEFWTHAFIQPFGELVINEPERGVAATDGAFLHLNDRRSYREVVLNRNDVHLVWPKAKMRVTPNPYSEAVTKYWKQFSSNPDREFDDEFSVLTAGNLKTDC